MFFSLRIISNFVRKTIVFLRIWYVELFKSLSSIIFVRQVFFLFETAINEFDFHDIKNRSISVKSSYIFNWIVNSIKLRRNIRAFLTINSLYVKFVTLKFIESNLSCQQNIISDITAKKVIYRNFIDSKSETDIIQQFLSTFILNV